MKKAKFFRRRQFALGPNYFHFEGWKRYTVAESYCLTVHPDLTVQEARNGDNSITLLGYLIDPYKPERKEVDILNEMIMQVKNLDDIITFLERMSGRFIIFVVLEGEILIFHDASGLRQVLYCRDEHGRSLCASQAETLAEQLGFSVDQEVLEYWRAPIFRYNGTEFWMVNDRTFYKEILQLLPNHFLDFRRGRAIRFWPKKNSIPSLSVQEGVRLSIPIIKNSIEAVCNKFEIKMGISAGIDSRKTLAATKDVRDKILYFTHENDLCGIDSMDVKVPAKLLPKLGIRHNFLNQMFMSKDFKRLYEDSATFARENKGNNAYILFYHFGIDFAVLSSNLSEISQCNYWLPKSKINGEGLAVITGLYHPLAIKEFDKWVKGAQGACEESGINILGLFHWEQRGGRWASAAFGEYDIVHESFTPYNNRYLNKILVGISERYRRDRMWYVALRQIQNMWPEVLSEAVNPGDTLGEQIRELLRRQVLHKFVTPWLPIYEYFKFLRKRIRLTLQS